MFARMALQRYLLFAQMEGRRKRAETVRPDHVLLGLPQQKTAAGRLLENVWIEAGRATLAPARTDATDLSSSPIPHSPDTDRLVQRAQDEARALQQPLTEEHLLRHRRRSSTEADPIRKTRAPALTTTVEAHSTVGPPPGFQP